MCKNFYDRIVIIYYYILIIKQLLGIISFYIGLEDFTDWRNNFMKTAGLNKENEICTCNQCGKIFVHLGGWLKLCKSCKELDDQEFDLVKEYIFKNPLATVKDTTEATGVRPRKIREYLRAGRLLIPDNSPIFINCENCEANIKFGRLCKECADSLTNEVKKSMNIEEYHIGERPKPAVARMHYLNNERK